MRKVGASSRATSLSRVNGADGTEAGRDDFQRYPAYKNSGVDWLGDVPAHWNVKRLKFVAPVRVSKLNPKPEDAVYVGLENIEPWTGRLLTEQQPEFVDSVVASFRAGDVLFGKLRPYLAKAARPQFDGVCTSEIVPFRPTPECSQSYLMYCFLSMPYVQWLDSMTYGTKMPRISPDQLAGSFVPVPPKREQCFVSAFLDRETAKIDSIVAKNERLVELLQEERTALIIRAVTQGVDNNVPMKDSGFEWLGEIPVHWSVERIKFVARLESGHTPSRQHPEYWEHCTIPWFGLADVWQLRDGRQEYVEETTEKISTVGLAHSAARLLPKGTVILSRTASVGFSAIMATPMATTQDFVNWVCRDRVVPEYLLYVFRSMSEELSRLTMGSTHQTIYMPDAGRFVMPVPPLEEQHAIVQRIRSGVRRLDSLTDKIQREISCLKEYRTTLIAAAVTGKIDVRGETRHDS